VTRTHGSAIYQEFAMASTSTAVRAKGGVSASVVPYPPCISGKVLVRAWWHAAAMESGEANAGTEGRSRRLTYATTVTTLPALAGIVLGLLYTIGALVSTAELRGAGMTVGDTITLVPIEEHLGRGIAVVLSPATFLIVGVAAVGGLLVAYLRARPPREIWEPPLWLSIVLIACVLLLAIVFRPFQLLGLVLACCAVFGVFGATGARLRLRPYRRPACSRSVQNRARMQTTGRSFGPWLT
jgi:hypothetical protein